MKNKLLSLFMVIAMLFTQLSVVTVSASTSVFDDDGSIILRPIDATYISQHGTDNETNYYGESVMKINNTPHNSGSTDYGQYGYMKFDISGIEKERITSAKLKVYVENAGDKSSSTRTIGIYDTCGYDWDGTKLTWNNNPYPYAKTQLGTFEVNANGASITDAGWREIDITDYVRDNIEDTLSFMAKMQTWPAYNVVLSSGTYTGSPEDFDSSVYNEKMPQIVIDYCAESATTYSTTMLNPIRDTYVDQHAPSTNYLNNEYMKVNFTDNETRSDRYGSYAYMDFDISDINKETMSAAKLWVYVDPNSDTRRSTRTIGIFAPSATWSDSMTWSNGRVMTSGDAIGTYTVTGNDFDIIDYGWKCIDVTDYIKNISSSNVSFLMKAISGNAHPVLLRSNEHSDVTTRPRLIINTTNTNVVNDKLSVNFDNNEISITGFSDSRNKQILIRIFNPNNSLILVDQITSDNSGNYNYNYSLNNPAEGTYQVLTSIEGEAYGNWSSFYVEEETDTIYVNPVQMSNMDFPSVSMEFDERNDTYYTGPIIKTIIDNSDCNRECYISTIVALYDNDGTMIEFSSDGRDVSANEISDLITAYAPDKVLSGYTLKVFAVEGKDVYSGSMIPVAEPLSLVSENAQGIDSTTSLPHGIWATQDGIDYTENVSLVDYLDIEETYSYNGIYCEKVINEDTIFTVDLVVENKSSSTQKLAWITGDPDNPEQGIFMGPIIEVKPYERVVRSISHDSKYLEFNPDDSHQPEDISNWTAVTIGADIPFKSGEKNDFYGNTLDTATLLANYDWNVEGRINTSYDVDVVKFIVPASGDYKLDMNTSNVNKVLYDSNQTEIQSWSGRTFTTTLEAGKIYYLKMSGNKEIDYTLEIKNINNNTLLIDCIEGDYISIPITVSEAVSLQNYEFVVSFNLGEFDIISVNENDDDLKTVVPTANKVTFISNYATNGKPWTGIINCIKLRAKKTGTLSVTSSYTN